MCINIGQATAITTASIAVIVAIVTWREWITNRSRLRHELFDRRYAIYEQISGFLADVLQTGQIPKGEPEEFLRRTKKAYFAFACDQEIRALITEIYQKAAHLDALTKMLGTLSDNKREKNVKSQQEVKDWFKETLGALEKTFEKYLKLTH